MAEINICLCSVVEKVEGGRRTAQMDIDLGSVVARVGGGWEMAEMDVDLSSVVERVGGGWLMAQMDSGGWPKWIWAWVRCGRGAEGGCVGDIILACV